MCELKSQQSAGETKALLMLSLPDLRVLLCIKIRSALGNIVVVFFACCFGTFVIGSPAVCQKVPRSAYLHTEWCLQKHRESQISFVSSRLCDFGYIYDAASSLNSFTIEWSTFRSREKILSRNNSPVKWSAWSTMLVWFSAKHVDGCRCLVTSSLNSLFCEASSSSSPGIVLPKPLECVSEL